MSTSKKPAKNTDDIYAALQSLIAKGRKEGMIRTNELNAQLEKMDLTPEKIEEIYDRFEALNIQLVGNEMELELDDDLDLGMDDGLGGDIDLAGMDDEDLVDPVDLAAEYSLSGRSCADVSEGDRPGEAPVRGRRSGAGQAGLRG